MGSPAVIAPSRKSPSSLRRANKPLVEKKRRARINGCLGQLKSLILTAMNTEGSQVSRLEKADILEMTVKYLRHMQHQNSMITSNCAKGVDPSSATAAKFQAGYTECAAEVIRYMDKVTGVTPDLRSRLEHHLVGRLRGSSVGTPHDVNAPYVSSSHCPNKSANDENLLHYQTAVDLANMASMAVHPASEAKPTVYPANQQQSHYHQNGQYESANQRTEYSMSSSCMNQSQISTKSSQPISAVSSSSSPPRPLSNTSGNTTNNISTSPSSPSSSVSSMRRLSDEPVRRRHSSSESFTSTASTIPTAAEDNNNNEIIDGNNNYMESFYTRQEQLQRGQSVTPPDYQQQYYQQLHHHHQQHQQQQQQTAQFDRPLHIHIPDTPPLSTSPSPPLLNENGTSLNPNTLQSESCPTRPTPFPSPMDEGSNGPPTILYGVDDYHMSNFTTSSAHHQNSATSNPNLTHPGSHDVNKENMHAPIPTHMKYDGFVNRKYHERKNEDGTNYVAHPSCARELIQTSQGQSQPLPPSARATPHSHSTHVPCMSASGQGHVVSTMTTSSPPTLTKEEPFCHRAIPTTQEFAYRINRVHPGLNSTRKSGFPPTQRALSFHQHGEENTNNVMNAPNKRFHGNQNADNCVSQDEIQANYACHTYGFSSVPCVNKSQNISSTPIVHPIPLHPIPNRCENNNGTNNVRSANRFVPYNPSLHRGEDLRSPHHNQTDISPSSTPSPLQLPTTTTAPVAITTTPSSTQDSYDNRSGLEKLESDQNANGHEASFEPSRQISLPSALSQTTLKKRHLFAQQRSGVTDQGSRPLGPCTATRALGQGAQLGQQKKAFPLSDIPSSSAHSMDAPAIQEATRLTRAQAEVSLVSARQNAVTHAHSAASLTADDKLWRPW